MTKPFVKRTTTVYGHREDLKFETSDADHSIAYGLCWPRREAMLAEIKDSGRFKTGVRLNAEMERQFVTFVTQVTALIKDKQICMGPEFVADDYLGIDSPRPLVPALDENQKVVV